jgi:hypothetical protein
MRAGENRYNDRTFDLTADEKAAIAKLRRLANTWPATLWLFSGAGKLCVMRRDGNGERAATDGGGVDPDYVITTIDIPNDGGDW